MGKIAMPFLFFAILLVLVLASITYCGNSVNISSSVKDLVANIGMWIIIIGLIITIITDLYIILKK